MNQERADTTGAPSTPSYAIRRRRSILQSIGYFCRRKPLGAFGATVAMLVIIVAIFAPLIATDDPLETNAEHVFAKPGADVWLGGDQLGRDVFSRLVYGSRISLKVGLLSVFFGITLGAFIGVVSAYFGGKTDLIIQRIMDALMAFPALILAMAVVAALGASATNVIVALSIVFIPGASRTIRSQVLSIKEMDYVLAARAVGGGDGRIILRHIAPNCAGTYIVLATVSLGWAIVVEASLSFLGLGVSPETPSWGGMLTGAARTYIEVAPWLAVFPGLTIAIVVFGYNLLGDALRDVLDPRLRGT